MCERRNDRQLRLFCWSSVTSFQEWDFWGAWEREIPNDN